MTTARHAAVVAVPVLLLLAACTPGAPIASPSPSPTGSASATPVVEPTRPAAGELAISPEGMGTLVLGEVPPTDPALAMIVWDPDACAEMYPPVDPEPGRWVALAEYDDPATGGAGFGVALTPDDVLARIDVFDPAIPTTEGVRIGDPDTAVEAAYPDATVVREFLTDVYVVTGDHGTLQIEVARDTADLPGYWGTQVDRVVYLHATEITHPPFTVAASENIAGGCL